MAKTKKKATSKKKVVPAKKVEVKKESIKVTQEVKPKEIKAMPSFIEIPYVPRKIDKLPQDLNKLKK